MRRERWQAILLVPVRRITALTLLVVGVTLLMAGCGRIPESVAATLSAPTAAPTRTPAPATPTAAAGSTAASAPAAFKLAETPSGNANGGKTLYMLGCMNCHGMGGAGGTGSQVALVGPGGLIITKDLDTAAKFAMAVIANPAHAGIKDNDQIVNPDRLNNMYAYLVSQLNG